MVLAKIIPHSAMGKCLACLDEIDALRPWTAKEFKDLYCGIDCFYIYTINCTLRDYNKLV